MANDGGSVFPSSASNGIFVQHQKGMSIRDWYAGMALPEVIRDRSRDKEMSYSLGDKFVAESIANDCFVIAEAMIEAGQEKETAERQQNKETG